MEINVGRSDFAFSIFALVLVFAVIFPMQIFARDTVTDEFNTIADFIATPPASSWMQYAYSADSMPLAGERDPVDVLLRRTRTVLDEFNTNGLLDSLDASLSILEQENNSIPVSDTTARLVLFRNVDALSRRVAFANPLLKFKDIVFLKRPNAKYNHMCDQYFGFHGMPGGGIYILENAFSDNPTVRDVLANSVVANGRFQGLPLNFGSFCNPSLSYDGKTIFFSHTETGGPNYTWTENTCYHLFRVNVDGSDLRQLTDGPVNDLHPYPLPSGRIVFISDRRGGYGRCHARKCPTYTLYTVNADGTDITMLSAHETNEWHPSVDNDGMIIYTRWDYVDRHDDQAHHPWITYPDGRDARSIHGNWKLYRDDSPYMEQHVRAIPHSHKYVATASPHHGQTFGSFVLIDPRVKDDDKMSPLEVLTPDAQFPEATTGSKSDWKYASAWALSERFYLCGYDPYATGSGGSHALTLLDAKTGLKTTVYHDPALPCYHPVPLTARPVPPLIPHRVASGLPLAPGEIFDPSVYDDIPTTARIALMNVYDSTLPFPDGTQITHLRIYEILPKTTWDHHTPHVGYAQEDPARRVLGTVPVEADGSAYFTVPADTPIFFQALNADGMAVQSMRSLTYAKPGEILTCAGCHEYQGRAPLMDVQPSAVQRAPSDITPEVEGSNPFSFPRLVQPIFDAKCVTCHQQQGAIDLSVGNYTGNANYWYNSYLNLIDYAFFYGERYNGVAYDTVWGRTPISTPGQVGAMGSRLYQEILSQDHYGVQLTPEEMRRITLWLDSNSDFFGAYENTLTQAQGQIVEPLDPRITGYQTVVNTDYSLPAIPAEPNRIFSNNNGLSDVGSPLALSVPMSGGIVSRPLTLGQQNGSQTSLWIETSPDSLTYVNETIVVNGLAILDGEVIIPGTISVEWSQVTGPVDAIIGDSSLFSTSVRFPQPGSYILRLTAFVDGISASDDILITVLSENQPPLVDVGSDLITTEAMVSLNGSVYDNEKSIQTQWSVISGPGIVSFSNHNASATSASFSELGNYVLQLAADDGSNQAIDHMTVSIVSEIPVFVLPDPGSGVVAVQQAEDAVISNGYFSNAGSGWNGTGYVDLYEGGYVEFTINVSSASTYALQFSTAGAQNNLAAEVTVNGTVVNSNLRCPNTGSWNSNWRIVTETDVSLHVGNNTVRFRDNGNNQPQIDQIAVVDNSIIQPSNASVLTVSTGSDVSVESASEGCVLYGTVITDGLSTAQWSKAGGPGDVVFSDPNSLVTKVSFSEPGEYLLELSVIAGDLTNSDRIQISVNDPIERDYLYASPQEVAWSPDGTMISVSDIGLNRVVVIDAATQSIVHVVPVEGSPRGMTWVSITEFWVCEYDAGTLALIDASIGCVVRRIGAGSKPYDIVFDSARQRLVVTEYGLGRVRIVDIVGGTTVAEVPVVKKPMHLALAPDSSFVLIANSQPHGDARKLSHAAVVSRINLNTLTEAHIALPSGATSLRGIAISPDGNWAYITHLLGRTHLPTTQLNDGWVLNNVVTILDLTNEEVYATVPLDAVEEGVANPWGLALTENGNRLWICGSGVHELISVDLGAVHNHLSGGAQVRYEMSYDLITLYENNWIERIPVAGKGPRGLAISSNGAKLAVASYFGGSIHLVDAATRSVLNAVPVGPSVPVHALRRGEQLYFDGDGCFQRWLSCSSCHPGARSDGLNWDLLNDGIGNPKGTMSHLFSTETPPSMASGVRDDVSVAIAAGFKFIQFQQRSSQEMQDVFDYLASIRPEASPHLNKKWMTSSAIRGKQIFQAANCGMCHSGSYFTNLQQYDVGTGHPADIGPYDPVYDTPTLLELWRTEPYLHDGSASTLRDVVTTHNLNDQHGVTSNLSSTEIDDLVAYLQQISGIDNWVNEAPVVNAGPDQKIISPTNSLHLNANASDEGLPASTLSGSWVLVDGPNPVVFSDPTNPNTDVTFTTAGEYLFEFVADDGEFAVNDTMLVTVYIFAGDLTFDGKVNMQDLAKLGQGWQDRYNTDTLKDVANDWLLSL